MPFVSSIRSTFGPQRLNIGKSILRARINLYVKNDGGVGHPHTDWKFDHNVFMYYINDSDGDTLIYKELFNDYNLENLSTENAISPKMGRGAVFNGSNFHSASNPITFSKRAILNISFV